MAHTSTPGTMHIVPVDPSTSGLSWGEQSYAPLVGTRVYEVPADAGHHLVKFGHWRTAEETDYATESDQHAEALLAAVGRPSTVDGRRSGHRPVSPEQLAELRAQMRQELLAELAQAGLVIAAAPGATPAPGETPGAESTDDASEAEGEAPEAEEEAMNEEPEDDEEEEPEPAPVRRPAASTTRTRPGRRR